MQDYLEYVTNLPVGGDLNGFAAYKMLQHKSLDLSFLNMTSLLKTLPDLVVESEEAKKIINAIKNECLIIALGVKYQQGWISEKDMKKKLEEITNKNIQDEDLDTLLKNLDLQEGNLEKIWNVIREFIEFIQDQVKTFVDYLGLNQRRGNQVEI